MKKTISLICLYLFVTSINFSQEILGPEGSEQFGSKITVLPNGNFVVIDSYYDEGGIIDVGAVYLYNGATKSLISTLKGSTTSDLIGNRGVFILANGNFVVSSSSWDNGSITDAGAVTWCSSVTGISGEI